MDYYSDFPAPSEDIVISEVSKYVKSTHDKNAKIATIIKYTKESLDEIGGSKNLGSMTGYLVFSKKELISKTIKKLDICQHKYLSFKTLVQIILIYINLHNLVLHNRYKPLGEGYYEAEIDFNIRITNEKLPPIGNKPMYTPIKEYIKMNP